MRTSLLLALFITGCSSQPYRSDCLGPDFPAEAIDAEPRSVTLEVPVYFTVPNGLADTTTTVTAVGTDRSLGFTRTVSLWDECLDGALIQQEASVSFQLELGDETLSFDTEGYIEFPQDGASDEVAIFAFEGWTYGEEPPQIRRFVPPREPDFIYEGTGYQLSLMAEALSTPTGFFDLAVDRHDGESKRTIRILTSNLGPWGERTP